ncbi:MAG: signal peptidase II [Acidobacteriota bacterium]
MTPTHEPPTAASDTDVTERASEAPSDAGLTPESGGADGTPGTWSGKAPFALLSLAVLALDQWSKQWIETTIPQRGGRITIVPDLLDFIYVRNTGLAFGLFAEQGASAGRIALLVLVFAAVGFVGYYFWSTPPSDRVSLVALGLVLGGAFGNLVDRVGRGAVTDFIDFYVGDWHWHTFNVADSAITVGFVLIVLGAFRKPPATEKTPNIQPARAKAG